MIKCLLRFIVLAAAISAAVVPCVSEPNPAEVQSFRALVADYSRTSGGYSPALSPDGKTVAYMSSEGDIWVLPGVDLQKDQSAEPWRLVFTPVDISQLAPNIFDLKHARNLDWSPDGRRLAIAYMDGRLYVAESFDFASKTAQVRALTTDKQVDTANNRPYALGMPRWSPDGKNIACVRELPDGRASVLVVDVATKKVSQIAEDAISGSNVWDQPWSPDGVRLAYGSKGKAAHNCVTVVSTEGKVQRTIPSGPAPCPSWSLTSGKLAYALDRETPLKLSSDLGLVAFSSVIRVSDKDLSAATSVTKPGVPTPVQTNSALAAARSRVKDKLLSEFYLELTADQQKNLKSGQASDAQMSELVCLLCARAVDAGLERLIAESPNGLKSALTSSGVPQANKDALVRKLSGFLSAIIPSDWHGSFEVDSGPVWSLDGKKIAFIRSNRLLDRQRLCIVDLATQREREVFRSREIGCVTWSRDGKLLLLQGRRLMGVSLTAGVDNDSLRKVSTPGYPEVWMLQVERAALTAANPSKSTTPQPKPNAAGQSPLAQPVLKSAYICPGRLRLLPGIKHRFVVFGLDNEGKEIALDSKPVWKADPAAGTINSDGTFTATDKLGVYDHAVSVSIGGVTATANIEIMPSKPNGAYVLEKVIGGALPGVLNSPKGVAVDAKGFVYLADFYNHVVQKYDPSGKPIGTWYGWGWEENGFRYPSGIAIDRKGCVYVVDYYWIRVFDSTGHFLRRWPYVHNTGNPDNNRGLMLACDADGSLFVTDPLVSAVLKYDPNGKLLTRWGTKGTGNGQFDDLGGIAVDSKGFVYVSDVNNNRVQKFDSSGKYIAQWGSRGSAEGQFSRPLGITVDAKDRVYVADDGNGRVQVFDTAGGFIRTIGSPGNQSGRFYTPTGVAIDAKGCVLVADTANNRLQKLTAEGNFLAFYGSAGVDKGTFRYPDFIAADGLGCIYVTDHNNQSGYRCQKFDASGAYVTTIEGPDRVGLDKHGNCYVAGNQVTRYGPSGELIGRYDLDVPKDKPFIVNSVAVDDACSIWVCDNNDLVAHFDDTGKMLASFNATDIIGGKGGYLYSNSMAIGSEGSIYLVGTTRTGQKPYTSAYKFDPTGKLLAVLKPGEGVLATLVGADTVRMDAKGNLYVFGWGNSSRMLVRLDPAGNKLDESQIDTSEACTRMAVTPDGRVCSVGWDTNTIKVYAPIMGGNQ